MARKIRITYQPKKTNRGFLPLENLSDSGTPPKSRLNSPQAAKELADSMIRAGEKRNRTDAAVYGMVTGRQPYSDSELQKNGQLWRCNVNWGIGKSYLEVALTQPWDVVASAPTYCSIDLDFGPPEAREDWSKIVTEEFDRLNRRDRDLLYMFQLSQHNMVLYRYGPVVWFHPTDFRAQAIPQEDLFVLDNTKSNVSLWEAAVIRVPYAVHKLYGEIRNSEAATKAGWRVQAVKDSIMRAMPEDKSKHQDDWMQFEQRLANNDLYETSKSESVMVYWVLWREFPTAEYPEGAISMAAVSGDDSSQDWLYLHNNRYDDWRQVVCNFYYDNGDGTHYSVDGLGVKMFGALSMYDRIQCHAVDAAIFGAAYHFQALSDTGMDALAVQPFGPYMLHPPGTNYVQTTPMGQALDSLVGVKQDLLFNLGNNLALYRQQRGSKKGNPATATEIQTEVENTSILGKSQLTRYFEQLDDFWTERARRACSTKQSSSMPGAKEALEFQKRCAMRGVPPQALQNLGKVMATRTIGYGNAGARNLAYQRLMELMPLLNEAGRRHLIEDVVDSQVGAALMRRYVPEEQYSPDDMAQMAEARQSVGGMKVGVPPVLTPFQNPVIYAEEYIKAASGVVGSLQSGADPKEVFDFLAVCGPAIQAHLQRLASDPTRKQVYAALLERFKKLAQITDQLEKQLRGSMQAQVRKQQQLEAQRRQMQGDMALKAQESQAKTQLKAQEKQHSMQLKQMQTQQKMQLADAATAAKINLKQQEQNANLAMKAEEKANEPKANE